MAGAFWSVILLFFNDIYSDLPYDLQRLEGVKTMGMIENDDSVERIERVEKGERKGLYLRDFSDSELCLIAETCGESFLECHFAG